VKRMREHQNEILLLHLFSSYQLRIFEWHVQWSEPLLSA